MSEPETRARRLTVALDEFIRSSPDVEAAAVVSFDGLPMASALPDDLEEDRVGAMSAALLSLGEQAAVGLGRGLLNQVFVEGEHGFVFLMSARDQAVLTAIASRDAKIGFMLFEMRRAADRIGRALEAATPEVVAPEATTPPPVADTTSPVADPSAHAADTATRPVADTAPAGPSRPNSEAERAPAAAERSPFAPPSPVGAPSTLPQPGQDPDVVAAHARELDAMHRLELLDRGVGASHASGA